MSDDLVYRAHAEPVVYPDGDGLTFEGYAAVFNQRAHIVDHLGEYDEVIKPGAFKRSINARAPEFFFQHGKHPVIGQFPLGRLEVLREDDHGLFVHARLTDNWLISPVRDAIDNRAITGMSVAMLSPPGKASFTSERDGTRLRTVNEAKLLKLGPVVGPAYAGTEAAVRSVLHGLEGQFPNEVAQERLDLYARLAIFEQRAGVASDELLAVTSFGDGQTTYFSDTSEEPAPDERTSDEPVDESGTSDPEPAEERADIVDADEPSLDHRHQIWRIEMQRRGIRAEGQ